MANCCCPGHQQHPIFRRYQTAVLIRWAILRAAWRAISQVNRMASDTAPNGTETMGGIGTAYTRTDEPQGPYAEVHVHWNFTDRVVGRG